MSNDNSLVFKHQGIKGIWKSGVVGDPNDGYLTIYRLDGTKIGDYDNNVYSWEINIDRAESLFNEIIGMFS